MLPDEMVYADDADFVTMNEGKRHAIVHSASETLLEDNLLVNDDKTEHTVLERGDRNTET